MTVDEAEATLHVSFPAPLRAMYAEADGRYNESGQWWVIWPLDRVIKGNLDAWKSGTLSKSLLAFGDDGTGNPFCMSLAEDRDEVLRWSWIDGEVERSEGSLADFGREWLEHQ